MAEPEPPNRTTSTTTSSAHATSSDTADNDCSTSIRPNIPHLTDRAETPELSYPNAPPPLASTSFLPSQDCGSSTTHVTTTQESIRTTMTTRSDSPTFPPTTNTINHTNDHPDSDQPQTMMTEAMQLRLSLARRVISTLAQGGPSRNRLFLVTFFGAAQVVAWSVVLALSEGRSCDKPLRLYLILTIVKLGLSFPVAFYTALTPPMPTGRDTERMLEREATRQIGNHRLDRRIKRLGDLIWLFSLALFVLGNVWVISSTTCSITAGTLWSASVAALVLHYLTMFEALVVCICVILFLPFALYRMRGYIAGNNEVGPLAKKEMAKIEKRIFIGIKPTTTTSTDSTPPTAEPATVTPESASKTDEAVDSSNEPSSTPKRSRPHFWLLWRRSSNRSRSRSQSRSKSSPSSTTDHTSASEHTHSEFIDLPHPGILLEDTQSSCSICLCEYELPPRRDDPLETREAWEAEVLHLLPCGHCFHEPCSESWLVTSGRCPLCQKPVVAQSTSSSSNRRDRRATTSDQQPSNTNMNETIIRPAATPHETVTADPRQQSVHVAPLD